MATLEQNLIEFAALLEELQSIVEACNSVGVRLTNPRRLHLDRRRLTPFVGLERLSGEEANELSDVLEQMEHPDLIVERLQMAEIKGPAVRKFERLGTLKGALHEAAWKRMEQEEI